MGAPRLVYVVTHPVSAEALLRGQLAFMRNAGFDVTVVTSPGPELERVAEREGVRTVTVPMERPIRPAQDAISLGRLTSALASLRPDIVHASTPKAGLLGMIAARVIAVPVRIYLLRGLRLETAQGVLRRVLSATERIASVCADEVICNSPSLLAAAISGGHVPAGKGRIIGAGSSNGVDADRWARTAERVEAGRQLARSHGIEDEDEVIGFVGRFDPDKGIGDLLDAFAELSRVRPRARLLLVGGGYAGDSHPELARRLANAKRVVVLPRTHDLAPIYARLDLLAFPSFREGFPNVPLEAACAEVPAVGYRSTGVVDAISDGETGALVEPHDVGGLTALMLRYFEQPALRAAHGLAARERAIRSFSRHAVWSAWEAHYRDRLARAGLSPA